MYKIKFLIYMFNRNHYWKREEHIKFLTPIHGFPVNAIWDNDLFWKNKRNKI